MSDTIETGTGRLLAEKRGPVGWLTFNNPARHNAVGVDTWRALPGVLERFEADPDLRVVVVTGAGRKAFVSGADISEFEETRATRAAVDAYEALTEHAIGALQHTPLPTVAMIRGWCIGGGAEIALCCDLRIASEGARFGVPAAKLGLGYKAYGVKQLMDVVGPAFTKEIFFTARQLTAAEAYDAGLLNKVVPEAALEAVVAEYCERIAENAPLTVRSIKGITAELLRPEPDDARCEALFDACFDSEDYVEGRTAFMEKRKPVFRGR